MNYTYLANDVERRKIKQVTQVHGLPSGLRQPLQKQINIAHDQWLLLSQGPFREPRCQLSSLSGMIRRVGNHYIPSPKMLHILHVLAIAHERHAALGGPIGVDLLPCG